jgi:hypothetical protein
VQFFSQNNDLTKADVKYLEHLSIRCIGDIGNIDLEENKQRSACPHLPEHQKSAINEFFEDVKLIIGFLGYDFFEKIEKAADSELFFCKRNNIDAKGIYKDGKFVVLSRSKIAKDLKSNYSGNKKDDEVLFCRTQKRRSELLKDDFIVIDDNFIQIKKDILFESPSAASCFCVGMASNGWLEWKSKEGKTMDEIFRKNI